VFRSTTAADFNEIDPSLVTDASGNDIQRIPEDLQSSSTLIPVGQISGQPRSVAYDDGAIVVGFGDYRGELEKIAPPGTLFTGPLEHRHLVHLIPLCEVTVVPSIFPEAFGMVAAESAAGGALPLAVVVALVVCSLIALNIGTLAKYLPSAGGFFTFVSRGLGVQAGWMTGWLFSLTYLLIVPLQLLVLGPVADDSRAGLLPVRSSR